MAGVLDRDAADVPVSIHVQKRVLVQVLCLGGLSGLELDVERVSVLEMLDFHDFNDGSKKRSGPAILFGRFLFNRCDVQPRNGHAATVIKPDHDPASARMKAS